MPLSLSSSSLRSAPFISVLVLVLLVMYRLRPLASRYSPTTRPSLRRYTLPSPLTLRLVIIPPIDCQIDCQSNRRSRADHGRRACSSGDKVTVSRIEKRG